MSLFVHLDWARFELWVLALALRGLAFGALGVAIGGLAREVSAASLLAFLISLPIAFVALVPANAVSGGLKTVLDAIAFVFPFKAALQAVNNAFSGTSPAIGLPLLHLAVLAVVFAALARLALRRFAQPWSAGSQGGSCWLERSSPGPCITRQIRTIRRGLPCHGTVRRAQDGKPRLRRRICRVMHSGRCPHEASRASAPGRTRARGLAGSSRAPEQDGADHGHDQRDDGIVAAHHADERRARA